MKQSLAEIAIAVEARLIGDGSAEVSGVAALLTMSFAAFVVFLLIPTAPPWWAG